MSTDKIVLVNKQDDEQHRGAVNIVGHGEQQKERYQVHSNGFLCSKYTKIPKNPVFPILLG